MLTNQAIRMERCCRRVCLYPAKGIRRAFLEGREEDNERKVFKDPGVEVLALNHITMTKKNGGGCYSYALLVSRMPRGKASKTLLSSRSELTLGHTVMLSLNGSIYSFSYSKEQN